MNVKICITEQLKRGTELQKFIISGEYSRRPQYFDIFDIFTRPGKRRLLVRYGQEKHEKAKKN